jgi:tetratricopeptide (TPR) repeat protein
LLQEIRSNGPDHQHEMRVSSRQSVRRIARRIEMAKWVILGARLLFSLAPLAASNVFAQPDYRAPDAQRCAVVDCTGGRAPVPGAPNPLWQLIGKAFGVKETATPNTSNGQPNASLVSAQSLNQNGVAAYNSGDYKTAVQDFEQAASYNPNDAVIQNNLKNARSLVELTDRDKFMRLQQDYRATGNINNALREVLGNTAPALSTGDLLNEVNLNPGAATTHPPAANANTLNAVLDDPSVVDLSAATKTSVNPQQLKSQLYGVLGGDAPASGASAIVPHGDSAVVDLSSATKTPVDPQELKNQLYGVLGNHAPLAEPPDPRVQLPEARDIELLFQPPQSSTPQFQWPQRPADSPRLHNPLADPQEQEQIDAKFAMHGGLDDVLEERMWDQVLHPGNVPEKPAIPAKPAIPERPAQAAVPAGLSPNPAPAPQN